MVLIWGIAMLPINLAVDLLTPLVKTSQEDEVNKSWFLSFLSDGLTDAIILKDEAV